MLQAGWGRFLVLNSEVQDGLLARPNFVGYSVASSILPSQEGVPVTQLSNPYPGSNPLQPVTGKSLGINTNLGNGATFRDQDFVRTAGLTDSMSRWSASYPGSSGWTSALSQATDATWIRMPGTIPSLLMR